MILKILFESQLWFSNGLVLTCLIKACCNFDILMHILSFIFSYFNLMSGNLEKQFFFLQLTFLFVNMIEKNM